MHPIMNRIVVSLLLALSPVAVFAAASPALEQLIQIQGGADSAFAPALPPINRTAFEPPIKPVAQQALPGLSKEELMRLMIVAGFAQQNHIDGSDGNKLYCAATKAILKEFDQHSQFFCGQAETNEFMEQMSGSFGGIGAELLAKEKGKAQVVGYIYPGTPAEKAGLKGQDRIISVDGVNVGPLTTDEVVTKIRGPKGTAVKLDIERIEETGKDKEPKKVARMIKEVVRATIETPNVFGKIISPGKGYVYFNEFRENTADVVIDKIEELIDAGAKSLVIDLRNNPGGRLDVVNNLAAEFLPRNSVIVETRDRQGRKQPLRSMTARSRFQNIPVVVIVNAHSASASEIFAGALQDYGRAIVVGRKTYGKGTAQTLLALKDILRGQVPDDGSMVKLTMQKWYTPKGRSIQKDKDGNGGVDPDHVISVTDEDEAKVMAAVRDNLTGKQSQDPKPVDADLDKALSLLP